ncbi:malto-oligosyltrehalose synthase [Chitinispirillales bacterium ANBcel5]|uniref:malto-oligosyltrehalose synthase n=1 Tax=Cellulosispirillum alkaliphilum TaxID=3039283 RepID=UPI002A526FA6|nr:malto-oligosyltrehalose synthase [Chitinispirillales bacterium ANBcel5]
MSKGSSSKATYRIQFTPQFKFKDALQYLPYLKKLGITDIYASPVTRPRKGSISGYDVCDPTQVNPELGTIDEFESLLKEVKTQQMGWLQDIVPNHMAFSHENAMLMDVLEKGQHSKYHDFFDIQWDHQYDSLTGHVLAPFLNKPYGQCIIDGELKIIFEEGMLRVAYDNQRYPLSPQSYLYILCKNYPESTSSHTILQEIVDVLITIDKNEKETYYSTFEQVKEKLRYYIEADNSVGEFITKRLNSFSTGSSEANAQFDKLMQRQKYRLSYWKVATQEINYRRFFTKGDLICVRVEHEHVFDLTHSFVLDLVKRGLISGLRIDHIDGLFDPETYLKRIRKNAPNAYIVVDKILHKREHIPDSWPVDGTTGYDFLNHLSYVYCDTESERKINRVYQKSIDKKLNPEQLQIEKKRLIIGKNMAGDIDNLAHMIIRISDVDLMGRDITLYGLKRALVEVLTHFPVYRTYITSAHFTSNDAKYISEALGSARKTMPDLTVEFAFIERFLMLKGDTVLENEYDDNWKKAVMRFQLFTGPLMAKGFEDTFFYIYNRHIALNEIGGWPLHFGLPLDDFHQFIKERNHAHPMSMNTLTTHKTKRGEDCRARLQVIAEMPVQWENQVTKWRKLNTCYLQEKEGVTWPDHNDEYFFYQIVLGTFPFDGTIDKEYIESICNYMIKAIRKAKVHTAWIKPDEEYEKAVTDFVQLSLDKDKSPLFVDSLTHFTRSISWFGIVNSLSQTVLKLTLPGVPDIYQGTELWDLRDTDNRNSINFSGFNQTVKKDADIFELLSKAPDPHIKHFIIKKLLAIRAQSPEVFSVSNYVPLEIKGLNSNKCIAFLRESEHAVMIVIVPRFTSQLVKIKQYPTGLEVWQDTRVVLPYSVTGMIMNNMLDGTELKIKEEMMIGDFLDKLPFAVMITSK